MSDYQFLEYSEARNKKRQEEKLKMKSRVKTLRKYETFSSY